MRSTLPPPRPVSVNSLARASVSSVSSTLPLAKSIRSTSASADFPLPDEHDHHHNHGHGPLPSPPDQDQASPLSPVDTAMDDQDADGPSAMTSGYADDDVDRPAPRPDYNLHFESLPIEIHEAILDHLFGERAAAFSTPTPGKVAARCWNKSLRHPRRKALANLALICPVWRSLVQGRIYRHIKIKGTTDELAATARWFRAHSHLAPYVRQVEIWIPVWGKRATKASAHHRPARRLIAGDAGMAQMAVIPSTMAWDEPDPTQGSDYRYHYASQNATLEEIFGHVQAHFPQARILTLEGGHCKRPPMVRHFRHDQGLSERHLPKLPDIQTFVIRGAFNIMRNYDDWNNLVQALPGVREWHCAYAKPSIEGYTTIADILRKIPPTLVHMNISLEGFYNKDLSQSSGHADTNPPHLCQLLGQVAPRLESLAFTGKICSCVFQPATSSWPSKSRLKTLDVVVKSCCREKRPADGASTPSPTLPSFLDDYSGITNLNFIRSFESLVVGAVGSLHLHPALSYMRIRFIDLDSACPPLNPYFQLLGNECSGLWSESILERLSETRPEAGFVELADGIYPQYGPHRQIVGAVYPRTRPLSIHASTYKIIADVSKT